MRAIVVAGAASGVGKTTVACALMAAFRRRGRRVQPFKVGPDYIDPSHHAAAAGVPSRNLDSVLVPAAVVQRSFVRAAAESDIAIIEGVMGLFDGRSRSAGEGSTAEIAKLLGAPVVVVLDVSKLAQTAGAIALGCARLDPNLNVVGFILNRVASPDHAATAAEAVQTATGLPVFGALPRDAQLSIPERHLGLVPTPEQPLDAARLDRLADLAERELQLDRLWGVAALPASLTLPRKGGGDGELPRKRGGGSELLHKGGGDQPRHRARIAVARDAAFSFYYEDSLDLLEEAGAELTAFSPLADGALPPGTQGIYIGGGFPELFAAELAANTSMLASLRRAAEGGLPIYGECGGLMYLGQTLTDFDGRRRTMAGVVPMQSLMKRERVTLGYRTARALRASLLLDTGEEITGHEFHYSVLSEPIDEATAAYRLVEREAHEGYARGNVLASYVHVHFGADPTLAPRFVARCAGARPYRNGGPP